MNRDKSRTKGYGGPLVVRFNEKLGITLSRPLGPRFWGRLEEYNERLEELSNSGIRVLSPTFLLPRGPHCGLDGIVWMLTRPLDRKPPQRADTACIQLLALQYP